MTAHLQSQARSDLMRIYAAAIAAVAPRRLMVQALTGAIGGAESVPSIISAARGVRLLAVGKASLGMATEVEERLGDQIIDGLVIASKGSEAEAAQLRSRVMFANHPLPDGSSVEAARAALAFIKLANPGELVMLALSGGASSMIAAPAGAVTLTDKIAISSALMRAGATIHELNAVRKHLSEIKGGRLLATSPYGVEMLSLILSDVPGSELATIGSGPTAGDPTIYTDALTILKRRRVWGRAPETVRDYLERGAAGEFPETVKPNDAILARVKNVIIGDNRTAVDAAAEAAVAIGYQVQRAPNLGGEADQLGKSLAGLAAQIDGERVCMVAGGEPVVTVRGDGRGGRAQQCALAMAIELAKIAEVAGRTPKIIAMFAGTDGIDGPTDAAGGIATSETIARAAEAQLDPQAALVRNDAYSFFRALGDLVIVGPTGTNVADIFIALMNY